MKILKTIMLLYQYGYYLMREWDIRAGMPVSFTKFKAPVIFGAVETLVLAAAYIFVDRIILGQPIHELPSLISPIVAAFAFAFVVCYINIEIIGDDSRIHHYKEMFDGWDKSKRTRWKLYVIAIAVASLAAFCFAGKASQEMPQPQSTQMVHPS
jgi:phosphate/sulfate permease